MLAMSIAVVTSALLHSCKHWCDPVTEEDIIRPELILEIEPCCVTGTAQFVTVRNTDRAADTTT